MIDAISTSAAGLRTSANQFEKAAQKVVKATAPQVEETASASSGGDDLAGAIVDTQMSALSFKANAAVFKTGDKMMGALLDTIV